jgi:hypothetical protein
MWRVVAALSPRISSSSRKSCAAYPSSRQAKPIELGLRSGLERSAGTLRREEDANVQIPTVD